MEYEYTYVTNSYGTEVCYESAVMMMDDEIREELHSELAPCTEQEFFDAYCKAHEEKFGEEWVPAMEHPIM